MTDEIAGGRRRKRRYLTAAGIARLRETITEQAMELHFHRGKERWG